MNYKYSFVNIDDICAFFHMKNRTFHKTMWELKYEAVVQILQVSTVLNISSISISVVLPF